tara:strand:+ start:1363 stop:1629 length:267 start_codon:yes stop_codon:yes gene_type:complete
MKAYVLKDKDIQDILAFLKEEGVDVFICKDNKSIRVSLNHFNLYFNFLDDMTVYFIKNTKEHLFFKDKNCIMFMLEGFIATAKALKIN